jgi:hypothetical protein
VPGHLVPQGGKPRNRGARGSVWCHCANLWRDGPRYKHP